MFLGLLQAAGMDELLLREGKYTVFAPTTDALDEVDNSLLEKLMLNPEMLNQVSACWEGSLSSSLSQSSSPLRLLSWSAAMYYEVQ